MGWLPCKKVRMKAAERTDRATQHTPGESLHCVRGYHQEFLPQEISNT